MRPNVLILPIIVAITLAACAMQTVESRRISDSPVAVAPSDAVTPVLVELFTSEGCSSCPSAERALEFMAREQPVPSAEIIPLELHVEYWDRLGWKDPFSSAQFSARQEYYGERFKLGSVYTPQLVIDGAFETSGNSGSAARLIADAAKLEKASIDAVAKDGMLTLNIRKIPRHKDLTVFVATYENGLTGDVSAGENRGRKLSHTAVVRKLESVGSVAADQTEFVAEHSFTIDPEWDRKSVGLVVFVQENQSRKILGSLKIEIR